MPSGFSTSCSLLPIDVSSPMAERTTSFAGAFQCARFSRTSTRTFVVPGAELTDEFGLTETVGALPPGRAGALVAQVRERLGSCAERDLSTDVDELLRRDSATSSLTAWRLDISVTDERSVVFYMAFLRSGTALAQVGFVPAPGADLAEDRGRPGGEEDHGLEQVVPGVDRAAGQRRVPSEEVIGDVGAVEDHEVEPAMAEVAVERSRRRRPPIDDASEPAA